MYNLLQRTQSSQVADLAKGIPTMSQKKIAISPTQIRQLMKGKLWNPTLHKITSRAMDLEAGTMQQLRYVSVRKRKTTMFALILDVQSH